MVFLVALVDAQCPRSSLDAPGASAFSEPKARPSPASAASVPIPPEADLAIRHLALNYSLSIAAPWLRDTTGQVVAAGLNLSTSDGRRALAQAPPRKEARPSPSASSAAASFWVDPVKGSDSNPGDESKPWRTLERCVK